MIEVGVGSVRGTENNTGIPGGGGAPQQVWKDGWREAIGKVGCVKKRLVSNGIPKVAAISSAPQCSIFILLRAFRCNYACSSSRNCLSFKPNC